MWGMGPGGVGVLFNWGVQGGGEVWVEEVVDVEDADGCGCKVGKGAEGEEGEERCHDDGMDVQTGRLSSDLGEGLLAFKRMLLPSRFTISSLVQIYLPCCDMSECGNAHRRALPG